MNNPYIKNTELKRDEVLSNQNLQFDQRQTEMHINVNTQLKADVKDTEMDATPIYSSKSNIEENTEPETNIDKDTMTKDTTKNINSANRNNSNIPEPNEIKTTQETQHNLMEDGFTIVSRKKKKDKMTSLAEGRHNLYKRTNSMRISIAGIEDDQYSVKKAIEFLRKKYIKPTIFLLTQNENSLMKNL
ncbi:4450_t:CDS:2 [Cetraspora pellucida]|uniref:4450_t:CDS:1 n=1 Tax=Cetraspora pellucida TaxID=1433469 RepID=A0ACA9MCC0_9GLOM|nr:4450_t:CDS:2 [Cetraspora pellucida]